MIGSSLLKAQISASLIAGLFLSNFPEGLGNVLFVGMPHGIFAFVEGVAAGAMLTMIAETMRPEAYNRGGTVTGVSTLLGFLAAIFFKTLE